MSEALTQEELASKTGLTREYISQLELGKRMPALPVFVRLCRALGITTTQLVAILDRVEWPANPADGGLAAHRATKLKKSRGK